MTHMVQVTIASIWEALYGLSIGIFTFELDPF